MIEPPTPKSGANDTADMERQVPAASAKGETRRSKKLGLKEFIFTLIIIFLVWLGRRFFGP